MSKYLRSPNLLQRETPEALDRRILLAGAIAAAQHRRARRRRFIGALSGVAAAFAVTVVVTWRIGLTAPPAPARQRTAALSDTRETAVRKSAPAAKPASSAPAVSEQTPSENELLEFSDWTSMEQETYNLSSQVNCYQDVQDNGSSSQV